MIRRVEDSYRYGTRYRTRPGTYAILALGREVLLTHQAEPQPEFQLPGGGIDPGESPLAALHREVFEETGWRIAWPRRLGAYRRFGYMPEYDLWAEKICHVYLARPVRPHGDPIEPGHRAIWASPAEAVRLLASAGDRLFMARLLAGTGPATL